MDLFEALKERRSVRKFKNEKVDRELMKEIVDIAKDEPKHAEPRKEGYVVRV